MQGSTDSFIHSILPCLAGMRTCGLVAMTSASHAKGRQFDPGHVYLYEHGGIISKSAARITACTPSPQKKPFLLPLRRRRGLYLVCPTALKFTRLGAELP